MNVHKNARLTSHGRERIVKMVLSGQTPQALPKALAGSQQSQPAGSLTSG